MTIVGNSATQKYDLLKVGDMDIEVVIAEDTILKTKVAEVEDIILAQDTKVGMVKDKIMT